MKYAPVQRGKNLTGQAVIAINLTWQAVTIVPQLNGLRVQRGKNLTGQAGSKEQGLE